MKLPSYTVRHVHKQLRDIGLTALMEDGRKHEPKWFGHTIQSTVPLKAISEGTMEGRRKRGRMNKMTSNNGQHVECAMDLTMKDRAEWT